MIIILYICGYVHILLHTDFSFLSISTVNTGNVIQNNKNKDANNMLPGKAVKQMVAHSQKTIQNLRIKTEPIMQLEQMQRYTVCLV